HGPSRQQPQVTKGFSVAATTTHGAPGGRHKGSLRWLRLPEERMQRVVQARANVHVRDPRKVAVTIVYRNVIDRQRPLVCCQCPPPGRRILWNLTPSVPRVLIQRPNRIDRGELVESQVAVAHRIDAMCDNREQLREQFTQVVQRLSFNY